MYYHLFGYVFMKQTTSINLTESGGGVNVFKHVAKTCASDITGSGHKISNRIYKPEFPILHNRFRSEVQ